MTTTDRIRYRLVLESDAVSAGKLLGEIFSRHEPLALAVRQPASSVETVVALLAPKFAAEQLAVLAEDASDGTIVGVAIAHDFATPMPPGLDRIGESFDQIASLLDELEASYRKHRDVQPGRCAHVFMVGVDPASGRGIARRLIATVAANATARGYAYAFTEATSGSSQHVFRQLGFRELTAIPYDSFDYRGQRPFASLLTPPSVLLMERELGQS